MTAAGATGSPKTIPVTLTVDPPAPPALAVSPTTLAFTARWAARTPPRRPCRSRTRGSGTLDVTASDDAAWLTVTPASATAPATLTVTPSITGLAAGTYTATVTVTATTAGATGSPKTIAVTLTVSPALDQPGRRVGLRRDDGHRPPPTRRARTTPGTITGATRTAAGKFGGALSFNGTSNLVTVADAEQPGPHDGHDDGGVGAPDRPGLAVALA